MALLWLGVLLRVPVARMSQRQRAGALNLLYATHAVTFTVPSVRYWVDAAVGIADLAILLGHLSALLALIFGLEMVAAMTGLRRGLLRGCEIVFTVAMAACSRCF